MTDPLDRACSCGARPTTHVFENCGACCWCWVVEHAREPHPGHPECVLAAKRLAPIKARFQTAVRAEREACARIVEEIRAPTSAMTNVLKAGFRRNPDFALRAVLDAVAGNVSAVIRARIG